MSDADAPTTGGAEPPDEWGIITRYQDAYDEWADVPSDTHDALVAAMDLDAPPYEDGQPSSSGDDGEDPVGCHPAPERAWGVALQLYACRSAGSWGIGDLEDLRRLGGWLTERGAGFVLVNPIDAVLPTTPRPASPYFPSTRRFRDPIYLRPERLDGAEEHAAALTELAAEARAASAERIDRDAIWACKERALRLLFASVRSEHEAGEHDADRTAYATWRAAAAVHGPDWRDWPDALRDRDEAAITSFAADHADEIAFHTWLQDGLDDQLAAAGAAVALVRDLPIGFAPSGFDAWQWRELLADGVTIGAPPDPLGPSGQDWSLPAFVPAKLADVGYEPLAATLRAELQAAAGLRIDHVLGLFRLFWIPPDATAADGAYVVQPAEELLELVGEVSRERSAFVVGEDLGTVGAGVRDRMAEHNLLRTLVFWFEEDQLGQWPVEALATVSTHDLPTLAGAWTGADHDELDELGDEPDADWHRELRIRLAEATGLDTDADARAVMAAMHRRLGASPSRLVAVQLDDLAGATRRPNVPGTDDTRSANWSLPLPMTVEEIVASPEVAAGLDAVVEGRRAGSSDTSGTR